MNIRTRYIIVMIMIAFMSFSIGYMAGTYVTIKAVADVAKGFVDETLISEAVLRYSNHLKGVGL